MHRPLLLTSFDIWQDHHVSNSSDDLLAAVLAENLLPQPVDPIRKLPVDFELAPQQVIDRIRQVSPRGIICCGMAESRTYLELESNGAGAEEVLYTNLDLDAIARDLRFTQISHDAGRFVCNHLYYSLLKYLQVQCLDCPCLFVHVPVLRSQNFSPIVDDFVRLVQTIHQVCDSRQPGPGLPQDSRQLG
jgi:pyroglutamyl-peptidase